MAASDDDKAKRERTAMAAFSTTVNSYDRMSLVTFKSQEQFVKFIIDLHYRQTQKSRKPNKKMKAETIDEVKWNIFCQFPGIGPKGSTILQKSGITILELAMMDPKDIAAKFDGIGIKRAELISKTLTE